MSTREWDDAIGALYAEWRERFDPDGELDLLDLIAAAMEAEAEATICR